MRDAVENWEQLRPEIDRVLAAWNGRGLPVGFELELSPQRWDSFDQFVLAYYWAHCRYGDEPPRPRVAHRTGSEIDGETDISAGVFRYGATTATIDQPNTPAALDYFWWEALYRDQGLYVPGMLAEEPYDDEAVLAGIEDGSIFLSQVDQVEAFALHGGSQRNATALARAPEDLGFTNIPVGTSLALDAEGGRVAGGVTFSFREDSVFALPKGGPAPSLAYQIVKYTLASDVHAREVEAIGYLPIQRDVVDRRASLFRLSWMGEVLSAGRSQWRRSEVLPASIALGTGSVYAQLWDTLVRGQGYGSPATARAAIGAALAAPPKGEPLVAEPETAAPAEPATAASAPDVGPARRPAAARSRDSDDWPGVVVPTPPDAGPAVGPHDRKGGRR